MKLILPHRTASHLSLLPRYTNNSLLKQIFKICVTVLFTRNSSSSGSSINQCNIVEMMEDIKDVKIGPMPKSDFLNPVRMTFTQNGKKRYWDFVKNHQSVSCLLYNTSRNVLLFVKQFRPAVYVNNGMLKSPDNALHDVDWTKVPVKLGLTIELCAGIVDANLPYNEIIKKEVFEECGYDVPLENFQKLISYQSGIGSSGDQGNIFYAECTDEMKVNAGGGCPEEGELIQVVEMTVPELREYLKRDTVESPGGMLFAVMWFLMNKASSS